MLMCRVATEGDLAELAAMRWDFRIEEAPGAPVPDRDAFIRACHDFLQQGQFDRRWTYWIATIDERIVSHVFVQRVPKVPKPGRLDDAMGYVTNVYTRPEHRDRGIGTVLMAHVIRWAAEEQLEGLIVWPSAASVGFYERAGFRGGSEMLEYALRVDDGAP